MSKVEDLMNEIITRLDNMELDDLSLLFEKRFHLLNETIARAKDDNIIKKNLMSYLKQNQFIIQNIKKHKDHAERLIINMNKLSHYSE